MKTLAFNTGRTYTECGQRVAATKLESGHIVMLDIDRHIDYILPAQIDFTKRDIMWAYDSNMSVTPHDIDLDYSDYYEIVNQLRTAAAEVKCI
jgi:hypothetical protein